MWLKTAIPLLVFSVPVGQEFERSLLSGSALGSLTRAGGGAGKDGERDAGAAGTGWASLSMCPQVFSGGLSSWAGLGFLTAWRPHSRWCTGQPRAAAIVPTSEEEAESSGFISHTGPPPSCGPGHLVPKAHPAPDQGKGPNPTCGWGHCCGRWRIQSASKG